MSTTQIPDVTVLAAIDRAERHRGRPGVPIWLIFEHLGIPRRSRLVRTQLQSLVQDGAIELLFARGRPVIAIEGVVVLRDDAFPWRRYSHRSYVHSASPGAVLDLSLALVGVGIRRQGTWLWSDGVYMPPE